MTTSRGRPSRRRRPAEPPWAGAHKARPTLGMLLLGGAEPMLLRSSTSSGVIFVYLSAKTWGVIRRKHADMLPPRDETFSRVHSSRDCPQRGLIHHFRSWNCSIKASRGASPPTIFTTSTATSPYPHHFHLLDCKTTFQLMLGSYFSI